MQPRIRTLGLIRVSSGDHLTRISHTVTGEGL